MVNLRPCFFLYPGSKAPDYFFNTPKKLFNNLCVTDTYHLFLFSLCLKQMAVEHKNYEYFYDLGTNLHYLCKGDYYPHYNTTHINK